MSRPNNSGKPTKTVACEIDPVAHTKIKTLSQLTNVHMRDLLATLVTGHDLDSMLQAAMAKTFGGKTLGAPAEALKAAWQPKNEKKPS
ncbi:MAG TPA: hypothetical protein VHC69_34670 [Polyangiaceae bacterium]|nr:hypothetical protein [Polyangiaceae bacterium]